MSGPRGYGDETWGETWRRRAVTLPAFTLGGLLYLALLPLVLGLAALRDLRFGRRRPTLRLALFGAFYVLCEGAGLLASIGIWLGSGTWLGASWERFEARNLALQRWWARALFAGVRRLYSVSLEVEGAEEVEGAPFLLFVRHASLVDTLLPANLVSDRHGVALRYVLKRELLLDPCLDVAGLRTPNVFVRRGTGDAKREVGFLHRLAVECPDSQGVLIYPEGTRFTPARLERALERIAASGDAERLARARLLNQVLPPRTAGPQALLEARPDRDVLFLAHVGLDGLAKVKHFLDGDLVGKRIRARFWRAPAASIPQERAARIEWLDAQWTRLDEWVERELSAQAEAPVGR